MDRVLAELTRNEQLASSLNFFARQRTFLGVHNQATRLSHNLLKLVCNQMVQCNHRLFADSRVWRHLLVNTEDVGLEGSFVSVSRSFLEGLLFLGIWKSHLLSLLSLLLVSCLLALAKGILRHLVEREHINSDYLFTLHLFRSGTQKIRLHLGIVEFVDGTSSSGLHCKS